jgi:uncharacterized protein
MFHLTFIDIFLALPFAFFAGLIDAIAGGGGLILIPGLLLLFPNIPVVTLLGTNKLASCCGTTMSSWHFVRTLKIKFKPVLPAIVGAFICSALGAYIATIINNQLLRPIVFVVLLIIGIYTLRRKNLGLTPAENKITNSMLPFYFGIIGAVIGFYDGFLGPGTGSFLIICFVGWLGCSFLQGSAYAKLTNLASNLAAVLLFAASNHIIYTLALPMAVCNILGNLLGARLATKKGSRFVRGVFLIVIVGILIQFIYQML